MATGAGMLLKLLSLTYRFRYDGEERLHEHLSEGGVIFPFWHNRIVGLMVSPVFRKVRTVIIVSRHFDGELIVRIASFFGYEFVRGSTGKSGGAGLRGLERAVTEGALAGLTPDGPRGPRYRAHAGVAQLANITRRPAIHAAAFSRSRWKFNSWDRFELPKPFTEITVSFGEPVYWQGDFETTRLEIEKQMREQIREGEALYGREPDFEDEASNETSDAQDGDASK